MKCPYCAYPESKVVDSRPADEGASIRRRQGVPVLPQAVHHIRNDGEPPPGGGEKKTGAARASTGIR